MGSLAKASRWRMGVSGYMQKQFFAVVPYDVVQLSKAGMDISDKILGFFKLGVFAGQGIDMINPGPQAVNFFLI